MDIYGGEVNRLIEELGRLPGIGAKTAQRLAFYIISMPEERAQALADSIVNAKKKIRYCNNCYTITDSDLCPICRSANRNHKVIMVVETPRDLAAYERTNQYDGVYHVLHGVINPALGIGPADIKIAELMKRLQGMDELIIATGSGPEEKQRRCIYQSWSNRQGSRSVGSQAVYRLAEIWNVLMK